MNQPCSPESLLAHNLESDSPTVAIPNVLSTYPHLSAARIVSFLIDMHWIASEHVQIAHENDIQFMGQFILTSETKPDLAFYMLWLTQKRLTAEQQFRAQSVKERRNVAQTFNQLQTEILTKFGLVQVLLHIGKK